MKQLRVGEWVEVREQGRNPEDSRQKWSNGRTPLYAANVSILRAALPGIQAGPQNL